MVLTLWETTYSTMRISNRLDNVKASVTMEMDGRVKQLKAQGSDVIGLAAGEPDFTPPEFVRDAANKAIEDGLGRYTMVPGTMELRDTISRYLRREFNLEYDADEIIVTSGAKQALFNALYVLCDAGDEVVIPVPYWTSYPEMVAALDARPVMWPMSSKDGFRLDGESLERLLTPQTRVVMLNSPSNPSGAIATPEELREIADVLAAHPDVWVLSDDIYAKLVFPPGCFTNIVEIAPELKERTIVVNGLSKAYCMTGWRLGFAAGPGQAINAMTTIQGHTTSCANAIAQVAAEAALSHEDNSHLDAMIREYMKRAAYVHARLSDLSGFVSRPSESSFYSFPDITGIFGKRMGERVINSAMDFASVLLDEALVALVPGEAFGYPAGIRISYATSMEEIERAMDRIEDLVGQLRPV